MSFIPTLSNELSPRPRSHIGDMPLNVATMRQPTTLSGLRRDSDQRLRSISTTVQSRRRSRSDAECVQTKPQVRERSTSFASTQKVHNVPGPIPVQRLDRKISDRKVQHLLKLRNRKLKVAKLKGDKIEVFRLKNLGLFDEIEMPKIDEDESEEVGLSDDIAGQNHHRGHTLQADAVDDSFTFEPSSVNQGHTATLCWHQKLEYIRGLRVPDEFSQCTIHPTPSPCASASPSSTSQPSSPSSLSSGSRGSLRHTKIPSVGSSTLREFSVPPSPATSSSAATASQPSSPTEQSSIISCPDEEDPFLYIAKHIMTHAESNNQFKKTKRPRLQTSSVDANRSFHTTKCTCTNHTCLTYLSGPPSKHCRYCKLPTPQPPIAAAGHRINDMKTSALALADANLAEESSEAEDEYGRFEALQADMELVEMYDAETEKRCRSGVWWEGWLIVGDLKRQGIVGSKPYGCADR